MAGKPTLHQTEPQFRETVGRLISGTDHGISDPRPKFDPQQAREFREEAIRGRKEEAYVQALEAHGFKFWTDARLVRAGGTPTGEGLWRHPSVMYQMAITPGELLAGFETPEAFDRWVRAHKAGKHLEARRRQGLITPAAAAEARAIIAKG